MDSGILIGCIADDFTGAGDAASFLREGGLRTLLLGGIPAEAVDAGRFQAVVIALKTRTMLRCEAVRMSLEAADWLTARGAAQLYFKYCSTFDSTREGNIGPVVDALLERTGQRGVLLCPSLPVNRRTVRLGRLYVDGIPLDESSMKNHPLTPMWDSRIPVLMREQGRYPCVVLEREALRGTAAEVRGQAEKLAEGSGHFYIVPDYETDEDAGLIVGAFGDDRLFTGGSGLLKELAKKWAGERRRDVLPGGSRPGRKRTLLLAGSCSAMTLKQIAWYQRLGLAAVKIRPEDVLEGKWDERHIREALEAAGDGPALFYSSDLPEAVDRAVALGGRGVSGEFEAVFARLAALAYAQGFRNFIVAGGETSGAAAQALGFHAFEIGDSAAPGVPVLVPVHAPDVRLILKSGNFGAEDFLEKAIRLVSGGQEGTDARG